MPHKLGLELLAVSFNRTAPVSVADPGISKLGVRSQRGRILGV